MDNFVVRCAARDDLPELGRLGALLMRVHYEFDSQRFMRPGDGAEDGYTRFLAGVIDDDDAAIFVAEREGKLLGYVYAGIEPQSWKELRERAGFVHDLVVDPRARRSGLATMLMDAALEWLRHRSIPRVLLWTTAGNEGARALFAGLGFRNTMTEMTREFS